MLFERNKIRFYKLHLVGKKMDIGNGTGFPSSSLSNFSPHPFEIDGIQCNSMEGFFAVLKI